MSASPQDPLVVVVVGTDHHPFDRLVKWVDGWAARVNARVVIQHGTAAPPRHAEGYELLPVERLADLLRGATVAVCHGGPATIATIRDADLVPIVVARRPELGEHVDDHQVRFVERVAASGEVLAPANETELAGLLDRALSEPERFRRTAEAPRRTEAPARFAQFVDHVVGGSGDLRVLFIGGWGRSGSTLLDRMLAQIPGVFGAGELRDIWTRGVVENRLCGCGRRFHECEVWARVGEIAFGGWSKLDVREAQDLRRRFDRPWAPPRVLLSRLTPALDADVDRYVRMLERLYRGIAETTGARLIVDSSKIPTHALLLRRVPGIDLRVLHLVRDSRGVVFSWQKQVVREDARVRDEMLRYGLVPASARYVGYNAMTQLLRGPSVPYRLLRYEDLVARPREIVAEVLAFGDVDAGSDALDFLRDGAAELAPSHTVDGNPMRLERGPVPIKLDDAWRREMDPWQRALVTALTAPMLVAYGYPVRS